MALQQPLSQEQMLAQMLGAQGASGLNAGMPGAGGMPAPSGMPGTPALDPQMLAQALGGGTPPVNPMQMAGGDPAQLFDPGSFGGFLQQVRAWQQCVMDGRSDCGPQPTRDNPLPPPTMTSFPQGT